MNCELFIILLSSNFIWKVSGKNSVRETCRNILHNPVTIFVNQIEGRIYAEYVEQAEKAWKSRKQIR